MECGYHISIVIVKSCVPCVMRKLYNDFHIFFTQNHESIKKRQKTPPKRTVIQIWQGHLCNLRTDFIRDLLLFGKEMKIFLQNL